MNTYIRREILKSLESSKRALNSRVLARAMSRRFHTSIQRIYGNLGYLTKSNAIVWISRKKGGPSYIKV